MRSKYNAKKTIVDDITFDSGKEASRYGDLMIMQRAGIISNLILQPPFDIVMCGIKCGSYRADFLYVEEGEAVVEDVKGFKTAMYRFKKKLVEAQYGFLIHET